MSFVQMVEFRTRNVDAVIALDNDWQRKTAGRFPVRRTIITQDHEDPDRCRMLMFFDNYETAVANAKLPESTALAKQFEAMVSGEVRYFHMDVVDDVYS